MVIQFPVHGRHCLENKLVTSREVLPVINFKLSSKNNFFLMLDSAADLMKLDNLPVLKDWSSGSGGDTNECDLQY